MRSSTLAAVTMGQLQKKLDLIGHNVANVNTAGYKTRTANFSSLLFQQIDNLRDGDPGATRLTPEGIRQGNGARLAHTNVNMASGTLLRTERPLDVALTEDTHFFQVQVTGENGVAETHYTRGGNFYLQPINDGAQSMLVTAEGHPIVGENGPIILAEGFDGITINENGQVMVSRGGQPQAEASIEVVNIDLPRSLEAVGGNRYRFPDEGLGVDPGVLTNVVDNVKLQAGSLESSNVDLGQELVNMMEVQRAFQFNARSITIGDQMMGLINQLR